MRNFIRVGLGTAEPNSAISILENDVEIGIGSPGYGVASIGTFSNSSLSITTDNISRILIKNSGEIKSIDLLLTSIQAFNNAYNDIAQQKNLLINELS